MSDVKGGDDLGVFDDLVAGKGWSIAPPPLPEAEAAPKTDAPVVIEGARAPQDSSDVIELDASQVELGPLRTVTKESNEPSAADVIANNEPTVKADVIADSEPTV